MRSRGCARSSARCPGRRRMVVAGGLGDQPGAGDPLAVGLAGLTAEVGVVERPGEGGEATAGCPAPCSPRPIRHASDARDDVVDERAQGPLGPVGVVAERGGCRRRSPSAARSRQPLAGEERCRSRPAARPPRSAAGTRPGALPAAGVPPAAGAGVEAARSRPGIRAGRWGPRAVAVVPGSCGFSSRCATRVGVDVPVGHDIDQFRQRGGTRARRASNLRTIPMSG